ncbi:8897_t:CDS:2 [Entrophospora sp. SA101]|nr:8897_t:CDS:2 [Entrophospora sp. SA101]
MSIHTKQPQVDLRFFELPATIALIEAIRNPLIIDLKHKKFKKLTSQELSIFLGRLQIFQEEKLGTRLNISKKSTIPTKIPSKLFKFGSTTLTTKSPIYHILKSAYKFKYSKKWDKWNWDDVEDIMEMITMIRGALIKKKIIKIPIIQFSHSLDSKTIKKLKKLVKRLGGQVADDDDQNVTHIIHKSNDYDDQDEEWFRTLEKKDGKVLMHWWYYPDSYDTWVEETSEHANPEPAPINNGPWNVGKRWINDSIKFNEWMNEEDYEISDLDNGENAEENKEAAIVNLKKIKIRIRKRESDEHNNQDEVDDKCKRNNNKNREKTLSSEANASLSSKQQLDQLEDSTNSANKTKNNIEFCPDEFLPSEANSPKQQKRTLDQMEESNPVHKTENNIQFHPIVSLKRPRVKSSGDKVTFNSPIINGIGVNNISKGGQVDDDRMEDMRYNNDISTTNQDHNEKVNGVPSPQTDEYLKDKYTMTTDNTPTQEASTSNHSLVNNSTENAEKINSIKIEDPNKKLYDEANGYLSEQTYEITIPSYSAWFNFNRIHEIEKEAMIEYFNNKNKTKTPEIYKEYRNFIINTYRLNPREYLSVTACRKNLPGDVCGIVRIHAFLEQWGLINYQPEFDTYNSSVVPPFTENFKITADMPRCLRSFSQNNTCIEIVNTTQKTPNIKKPCDILDSSYNSNPILVVQNIYRRDNTKTINNTGEDISDQKRKGKACGIEDFEHCYWSDAETLLLFEGVELHGDNWNMVSQHVGTRSKEQCIVHFLELPVKDPLEFTKSSNTRLSSFDPYMPFSQTINLDVEIGALSKDSNLFMKLFNNEEKPTSDTNGKISGVASSLFKKSPFVKNNKGLQISNQEVNLCLTSDNDDTKQHQKNEKRCLANSIMENRFKKLELRLQRFEEMESLIEENKRELQEQTNALYRKQPEVSELYDPHHPKHSLGKSEQTGVPPREGPSKIQMVQATIDNTKGEIQKTLHEMAKKGKKLEELEEQTMMLNETTTAFKAQTKKFIYLHVLATRHPLPSITLENNYNIVIPDNR